MNGSHASYNQHDPPSVHSHLRDLDSSSYGGPPVLQGFGTLGGGETQPVTPKSLQGFSDGSGSPSVGTDPSSPGDCLGSLPPRAASCPHPGAAGSRFGGPGGRSFSPESDAGYGTSYDSSSFSTAGHHQRQSTAEKELAELLVSRDG